MAEHLPPVTGRRGHGENGIDLDLAITPGLPWFEGHFPGAPILPGVVQLDWAIAFARRHLGLALDSAREFQIKFKAVIRPGDVLVLELSHDAAKGRLDFTYRRGEEICSTGRVFLP